MIQGYWIANIKLHKSFYVYRQEFPGEQKLSAIICYLIPYMKNMYGQQIKKAEIGMKMFND
jgi:hypothetical protein